LRKPYSGTNSTVWSWNQQKPPYPRRLSGEGLTVRVVYDHSGMPQNFIACDRGQVLLMPPALVDWVDEDHSFYGAYRANGQGRAAYDPAMMVALLI